MYFFPKSQWNVLIIKIQSDKKSFMRGRIHLGSPFSTHWLISWHYLCLLFFPKNAVFFHLCLHCTYTHTHTNKSPKMKASPCGIPVRKESRSGGNPQMFSWYFSCGSSCRVCKNRVLLGPAPRIVIRGTSGSDGFRTILGILLLVWCRCWNAPLHSNAPQLVWGVRLHKCETLLHHHPPLAGRGSWVFWGLDMAWNFMCIQIDAL